MKTNAVALLALIVWGLTVVAPLAGAGHRGSGQETQALDDGSLKALLGGLGYEPTKLSKGYLIAIKRDTWTYNMQFRLSDDGTKVGINANLGKVDNPDDVPAASWLKLLEANEDVDPSSFYFDKEQGKLYLHRVLDNRGITAPFVRQQVDSFCANLKNTADAWKFTK